MNMYFESIKQEVITHYESGTSIRKNVEMFSISRSTIYKWIHERNSITTILTKSNLRQLESKIKLLKGIVEILQSIDCTVNSPLADKLITSEQLYGKYNVHMHSLLLPQPFFLI